MKIKLWFAMMLAAALPAFAHENRENAGYCRQTFYSLGFADDTSPPASAFERSFIRVATYNIEKLRPKERQRLASIGARLRESAPDIIALQEVGDVATIETLNREAFANAYRAFFVRGQSDRHIHSAIMMRRDIPYDVRFYDTSLPKFFNPEFAGQARPLFPRGLPVLLFTPRSSAANEHTAHFQPFALIGAHLKSKGFRPPALDPAIERQWQMEELSNLIDLVKTKHGPHILIAGDFNGDLSAANASEFQLLFGRGLINSLNLGTTPLAKSQRYTQVYIPRNGTPRPQQLDGLLVSESFAPQVQRSSIERSYPNQHERLQKHHSEIAADSDHDLVYLDLFGTP